MTTSLSTPSLLELIELFERASHPILDSEGRPLHGVPAWWLRADAALSREAQTQWIQRIGFAGHYPAKRGEEFLPVELEEDDDPKWYRYRCPETFRMKSVPASQVAIYEVIPARFLSTIADLLDIPRALQGAIHRPAIEGALWCLGSARIGSSHTDVWFARGLTRRLADIFRYFHAMPLPDQGLVLTSSPPLAEFIPPQLQPARRPRARPLRWFGHDADRRGEVGTGGALDRAGPEIRRCHRAKMARVQRQNCHAYCRWHRIR